MSITEGNRIMNTTDWNFTLTEFELQALFDVLKEVNSIYNFYKVYKIVVIAVLSIIFVTGIIGNCLVLIVSYKNRKLRTINNRMISFLAISDLVFLSSCVPSSTVQNVIFNYPLGGVWCNLSQYLTYSSEYVTIYLLCIMAMERFCAISFPLKSRDLIKTKTMTVISMCSVVFACVCNIPSLYLYEVTEPYGFSACVHSDTRIVFHNVKLLHLHVALFQIFTYVLPACFLSLVYGSIFVVLLRKVKNNDKTIRSRHHWRAAKIVLCLVVVFFICFTPIQIVIFLKIFTDIKFNINLKVFLSVQVGTQALTYLNSCLNPILYTFVSKEYRQLLRSLFKISRERNYWRKSLFRCFEVPNIELKRYTV